MKPILSNMLWVPRESLKDEASLKKDLIVHPKPGLEDVHPIKSYKETESYLGIPRNYGIKFQAEDQRVKGESQDFQFKGELRNFQAELIERWKQSLNEGHSDWIIKAETGGGKCYGRGTPVLMYDGLIKCVEDVCVGDFLMGPDSCPRKVKSLARGREELFRVTPVKGDPYIVNRSHILSLKVSGNRVTCGQPKDGIVNICIDDYLKKPSSVKHRLKGWRTGVEFKSKPLDTIMDPYFLGVWLGDGSNYGLEITNSDPEVVDELARIVSKAGLSFVKRKLQGDRAPCYNVVSKGKRNNAFLNELRKFDLFFNKHIPDIYKINSRNIQLEILAGVLDADGYYCNGYYEIISKYRKLAEDILFVCRSLGLAAYMKEVQKKTQDWVDTKTYHKVTISGDCSIIPCRVERKKATKRKQKKDVLRTGITVESIGKGDYYGFEIEGNDRLFLLGDFTVTHNTVCSLKIAAELGIPFLVIVPLERLMGQWIEQIKKFLGIPNAKVGRVQGETCDYDKPICVGMIHSICKDKYPDAFKDRFGLIIYDECHRVPGDTFSATAGMFPAYYRLGVTATTSRGDGRENLVFYHIGQNILKAEGEKQPKPKVCVYNYGKSSGSIPSWATKQMQRRPKILNNLAANQERNKLIVHFADQLMQKGLRVLVVGERIRQLKELDNLLSLWYGWSGTGVYISATSEDKKTDLLNNGKCIFATTQIINIGIDVPSLRGLILATPMADCRQIVGRIRRKCSSVPDPVVVDIQDKAYKECVGWTKKRMKHYESKDFPIYKINK